MIITKSTILNSLMWKYFERTGMQGVNFIISLLLARLLEPNDYGLIALVTIFIDFANVLLRSGLNAALIQKYDAEENDFSSALYFSIFISIFIYGFLYLLAPYAADFYSNYQLIDIMRALAISVLFTSIYSIQSAYLTKYMKFKILFKCSFISVIISAIIGVFLAYNDFGVWALVAQYLSYQISATIILGLASTWRPKLYFSIINLKQLIGYGWKILISDLLVTIFLNIRTILIGKLYSASVLAYFDRGLQFPKAIINNVDATMQSVMFSVYSVEQKNKKKIKEMIRKSIICNSFVIFPLMIGLACISEPLIKLLLTDKWLPSVPYMQIFCLSYMLIPIQTTNIQAIKAMGFSDVILKLEVLRKIIELGILFASIPFGVIGIAYGTLIATLISLFFNLYPNIKLIDYKIREQFIDVFVPLSNALVMAGSIYFLDEYFSSLPLLIIAKIFAGGFIYFVLSILFNYQNTSYFMKLFFKN